MALSAFYSTYQTEHTQAVSSVLAGLADFGDASVLKENPDLLWEEVKGSVERFYRVKDNTIVSISNDLRFSLNPDFDPYATIDDLLIGDEFKNCAHSLVKIIEGGKSGIELKEAINALIQECEKTLDNYEHLHRISLAASIVQSSDEVLTAIKSGTTPLLSGLSIGVLVNYWKVGACDAVGGLAGGAAGAGAASICSIIMQL